MKSTNASYGMSARDPDKDDSNDFEVETGSSPSDGFLYCDTDSLKYVGNAETVHILSHFKASRVSRNLEE